MVSFLLSLVALVLGYLFYGKFVAHVFGPDDRPTPAVTKADGVDFIVLPSWKIFMIQFLNIAGTGPIFGAIMGAWYGPVAYLWIVLGCIFAGAMHDYMSGMLSIRHGGAGLPELVGKYLGGTTRKVMLVFSVLLLMMVGVVFVYSPAIILESICGSKMFWIIAIFVYYIIATLLPIDKIIGKVYPLFAISLLFMAAALMIGLIVKMPAIPELWDNLSESNLNANPAWLGAEPFMSKNPLFPCLFITFDAPTVVKLVCSSWLGVAGGVLALLGVVAAPITSGDTAFRSARLIIAEAIGLEQHSMHRRLYICIPMFVAAILLLVWQMNNPDGFNVIWQYFGWANQTLSVFTLWTLTVYLVQRQKPFIVTLVPALFMTVVCSTFLLISKQALGLQSTVAYTGSIIILVLALVWFFAWYTKYQRTIHS